MTISILSESARLLRKACLPALAAGMLAIPGAYAEERPVIMTSKATADEIREFCTNIADAARDQRYLLQKKELDQLQKEIDSRIETLETRRNEYEDWLKRRNDFLKVAEDSLVDIYKNMAADAAAEQLALIRPEIASAIVMRLAPRTSSAILAEMEAEKAAMLTAIIASASDPNTSKDPT